MLWQNDLTLFVDEAQYWLWSKELAWGYFSKPPMIAWIIANSQKFLGDSTFAIRFWSPVLYSFSAFFMYCLLCCIADHRCALWTGIVIITMPMIMLGNTVISTDAPLCFFWALSLLTFHMVYHQDKIYPWFLCGVFWGFGLLSKYSFIFLILGFYLFLLTSPGERKKTHIYGVILATLVSIILIIPHLYWNLLHNFPILSHISEHNLKLQQQNWSIVRGISYIGGQLLIISPILGYVFLYALTHPSKLFSLWRKMNLRFLLFSFLPSLILVVIQALRSGAQANWVGPAWLGGVSLLLILLFDELKKLKLNTILFGTLSINIFCMLLLYYVKFLPGINDLVGDPFKRLKGWEQLMLQLPTILNQFPSSSILGDDRSIMAHMEYELHKNALAERIFNTQAWSNSINPTNHFEMTNPFCLKIYCRSQLKEPAVSNKYNPIMQACEKWSLPSKNQSYIFVTRRADISNISPYFYNIKQLKHLTVGNVGKNNKPLRELYVYKLSRQHC